MRLRHGELEEMRRDIAQWVASKKKASSRPSMSYKHATRMGIYRLHRGDTLPQAHKYLAKFLDSYDLTNAARRSEATNQLADYAAWLANERAVSIATKARLNFAISPDITVGGEIPRIDVLVSDDGYRAVLLGEDDAAWASQLRMPLIQRAVGATLKRPDRLIAVGVQRLDGSGLELTSYSAKRMNKAMDELVELVAEASSLLNR